MDDRAPRAAAPHGRRALRDRWAIAGACPGPIAAQLGGGVWWSVFTLVGLVIGIVLFLRLERRRKTDDAGEGRKPSRASAGRARPADARA